MSIELMREVWKLEAKLTPAQTLVLLKLADNANDEGVCWPSQQNLAKACKISRETVNRVICDLSELGHLSSRNEFNNMQQVSNTYNIHPGGVTRDHRGCDERSQGGVTRDHRGCDERSHRTLIEPKEEPKKYIKKAGERSTAANVLQALIYAVWKKHGANRSGNGSWRERARGCIGRLKSEGVSMDRMVDALLFYQDNDCWMTVQNGPDLERHLISIEQEMKKEERKQRGSVDPEEEKRQKAGQILSVENEVKPLVVLPPPLPGYTGEKRLPERKTY